MKKEGRKKQASKIAKQHNTPKAVTFPKKNELPRVRLEPTTLYIHHIPSFMTCKYVWLVMTLSYILSQSVSYTHLPFLFFHPPRAGGFSQGGSLAMYSALTYPKKLAGILGLSTYVSIHSVLEQVIM